MLLEGEGILVTLRAVPIPSPFGIKGARTLAVIGDGKVVQQKATLTFAYRGINKTDHHHDFILK
jgi:hypothetical protein